MKDKHKPVELVKHEYELEMQEELGTYPVGVLFKKNGLKPDKFRVSSNDFDVGRLGNVGNYE